MKQAINFYQEQFKKLPVVFSAAQMALVLMVTILLMGIGGGYQYFSVEKITRKIADVKMENMTQNTIINEREATLALIKVDQQLVDRLQSLTNINADKRRLASYIDRMGLDTGRSVSAFYDVLSRNELPGVWLSEIILFGHGNDISLTGMSRKASDVPVYIGQLQADTVFSGLSFHNLQVEKSNKFPNYTLFHVDSRINSDEG